MTKPPGYSHQRWYKHFESIDEPSSFIARLKL